MRTLFISLMACLFLIACSDNNTSSYIIDDGSTLSIVPAKQQMNVGTTQQFQAWLESEDGELTDVTNSASWSSSATAVATVSNTGLASAVSAGEIQISAAYEGLKASSEVTVTDFDTVSLTTNAPRPMIVLGLNQQIEATAIFEDGSSEIVTNDATWTSADDSVVTVTDGKIYGAGTGTTTVTASFDGNEVTIIVEVVADEQMETATLAIDPPSENLQVNADDYLTAKLILANGHAFDVTQSVSWVSSNPNAVTVNDEAVGKGLIRAVGAGSAEIFAVIQATERSYTAGAQITAIDTELIDVEIVPANPIIHPLSSVDLQAIAYYANGSSRDVTLFTTWSSADNTAATVVPNGVNAGRATGVATGESLITASYLGMQGTTTLTVDDITAESLQLTPTELELADGLTYQYKLTAQFSDDSFRDVTDQATWLSIDPSIASIGIGNFDPGLVTAVDPGTTTIQAKFADLTISGEITITDASVTRVTVQPNEDSLPRGTHVQLTATAYFTDGSQQDVTQSAGWRSSDEDVATVVASGDEGGLVQAVDLGTAEISATFQGQSDEADITVTDAVPDRIALFPVDPDLPLGVTEQFTALGYFSDDTVRNITSVAEWQSSDNSILEIVHDGIEAGKGTAKAEGEATVTVTYMGLQDQTTATVSNPIVDRIVLEPQSVSIPNGFSQQFNATAYYTDNTSRLITNSATWESSNASVMTIQSGGTEPGLAEAVGVGAATISATFGGQTGTADATVTDAIVTSLDLTPKNVSLPSGTKLTFDAVAGYSDNTSQDVTRLADWSSSDSNVLTVVQEGVNAGDTVAHDPGPATLTVRFDNYSDSTPVTVTTATLEAVYVTPLEPTTPKGKEVQLTATAVYTDGTVVDITDQATWSSDNENVMVVESLTDNAGLAYGLEIGSANITATYANVADTVPATVTNAVLDRLVISPPDATVGVLLTQQYTATAHYSDNTTIDVTDVAGWQVTNGQLATIDSTGLLRGLSPGDTQVTADYETVSGSADVSIVNLTLIDFYTEPDLISLPIKGERKLRAYALYQAGDDEFIFDVTPFTFWRSQNTEIATVKNFPNNAGKVTAESAGSVVIIARFGNETATTGVTVREPTLQTISVSPGNVSLPVGASQQYTATGHYSDGSVEDLTDLVTWRIVPPGNVAAIDQDGLATALAQGSVLVTASYQGVVNNTGLTVTPVALTSIYITPRNISIPDGETHELYAFAVYSDDRTVEITDHATWVSLTPDVLHVGNGEDDNKGILTAVGRGDGEVRIAFKGQVATADYTVTNAVITGIVIEPHPVNLPLGVDRQLTGWAQYSDGSSRDITRKGAWSSADKSVAKVTRRGRLSSQSVGQTTVKLTWKGESTNADVDITNAELVSISISPYNKSYIVGQTDQLIATGTFTDSSTHDITHDDDTNWGTNDPSVLGVGSLDPDKGTVVAVGAGSATIEVSNGNISTSSPYQVSTDLMTGLTISPITASIAQGQVQQYMATAHFQVGDDEDVTDKVDWITQFPAVAIINEEGAAIGLTQGTTNVQATYNGFTDLGSLEVTSPVITGLRIEPLDEQLSPGSFQYYEAYALFSDNSESKVTRQTFWTSSDTSVASISNSKLFPFLRGLAYTYSDGTTTITGTYTFDSTPYTSSTTLEVKDNAPVTLTISSPSGTSMEVGDVYQLRAIVTYLDLVTFDLTEIVTWNSSDRDVAEVELAKHQTNGQLNALQAGSTTISASFSVFGVDLDSNDLSITVSNP